MSKNTSRGRGKQTSTPLSGNNGDESFKSFGNVSTIRNERKGARHSVTGSPITLDWKSAAKSPAILNRYKKITIPAKKLGKRRCDTPLMTQRKSRIPQAPVKLKFSGISPSSNINPKLSGIKRRRSARINKHLLDTDENPESKAENKEIENKKSTESEFCRNKNNIGNPTIEGCSKEISGKINVSFSSLPKRESLLQKEYVDKHEICEHTDDDSYETLEYTTESEFLNTSDMIESCRTESISVITSDTMDYLSGLGMLSDAYITSSLSEQSESPKSPDDDVIPTVKRYLGKNETSSKYKMNFVEFLPEASILVDCDFRENVKDESVRKRCKISDELSSNEIRLGELDQSKIKDGTEKEQQSKLSNASAGKENVAGCNLNLDELIQVKVDKKCCKKRNKYRKSRAKGKIKEVIQDHSLENNVNNPSVLLKPSDKSIIKTTNESSDDLQKNLTRKDIGRTGEPCKNHEDNQIKGVTISNHLENSKDCLDERLLNLSNSSDKHAIKITGDQYDAIIKGNNAENDENEKILKELSKSLIENPMPNSDNTPCHLNQKKNIEVEVFKKPFPVKKNAIPKQAMRDKVLKAKMRSFYSSTPTPVYDASAAEGKLHLVSNSLSPIRTCGEENKSYSLDDIINIKIKSKNSFAKPGKVYSEFDKEVSKWKSFRKKPLDKRKTCYNVHDSSISKSSGNMFQCENSRNFNEGVPIDDILILWNKFRSKKFKRKRKQYETQDTSKRENTKTKRILNNGYKHNKIKETGT